VHLCNPHIEVKTTTAAATTTKESLRQRRRRDNESEDYRHKTKAMVTAR